MFRAYAAFCLATTARSAAPAGLSQCIAHRKSDARSFVGNHATNEEAFRLAPMPSGFNGGGLRQGSRGCREWLQ